MPPDSNSWRSILWLSFHLLLDFSSSLLPKPRTHLSARRATYPTHLFLFDFISEIIFVETCGSYSSSLYSLLYYLVSAFRENKNADDVIVSVLSVNDTAGCISIEFRRVAALTVWELLILKQYDAQPRGWHVVKRLKYYNHHSCYVEIAPSASPYSLKPWKLYIQGTKLQGVYLFIVQNSWQRDTNKNSLIFSVKFHHWR
jgi:hypothetical protein